MFVDTAKITVFAGRGGKGCESYEPRAGRKKYPSGGDGGKGGNVILQADQHVVTLLDFYYPRHLRAESGGQGGSRRKQGRTGKNLLLKVPFGTTIRDGETGSKIRDLKKAGEQVIVANGGASGKGNAGGKMATAGETGETRELLLELRLMADCGIVGFPNVGKSTLLSKLTQARPKIANYPFTTKNPLLGVMTDQVKHKSLVVADIPGLIEGAHAGKGLGDRFLRHIERTSFLLHLVDMSGSEGREPIQDYEMLRRELVSYGGGLSEKPELLVANKMDLPEAESHLAAFKRKCKRKIIPISALTGTGLPTLTEELFELFETICEKES
ncbi:MAG: Obg family GTPase CgtA [Candidatus Omnitrophota bacterium]